MTRCAQELCPNWSGEGDVCPCAIFDLDRPVPCPTRMPEPHQLGEFPMTCYRCHVEADS